MSNKKHIDRLFQEKLKDFEAHPNPKVWETIQKEITIPQKEKKRIIPIWYKYAGIAAAILLLFTVGTTVYNSTSNETETIVDVEPKEVQLKNTSNTNVNTSKSKILNIDEINDEINIVKDSFKNDNSSSVASSNETTTNSVSSKIEAPVNKVNTATKTASYTSSVSTKTLRSSSNNASSVKKAAKQDYIVSTPKYSNTIENQKNNVENNTTPTNAVTVVSNSNIQKISKASGESNEEEINNAINAAKNESFSSTIAESSHKNEILKDSISTNAIENAVIAETENKSDKKKKEKESLNRWDVSATAAPVYYNTLTEGSHIDDQFIDNTKNGDINASYGINVGYALNDKLKVRSGINTLNLGYETTSVIVYENVANSGRDDYIIDNLNAAPVNVNGEGFSVISAEKVNKNQVSSFLAQDFNITNLKQQINYIEVPLELEYAVINKRVGINVIGGMSTFILGGNDVSTILNGERTQIGEVNNINPVSFSTNLGLGMDYDFSKTLRFNLEPTFKYQINAFNDTSGNFKPYLLGVYTGFSYKF